MGRLRRFRTRFDPTWAALAYLVVWGSAASPAQAQAPVQVQVEAPVQGHEAPAVDVVARLDVGQSVALRPQPLPQGTGATAAHASFARIGRVLLTPAAYGPLTVSVRSTDADVMLRLLDADGTLVAENDDDGIDWNARLVVEGARDETMQLIVGFKSDLDGELTVEARAGDVPEPEGVELVNALMDHHEAKGTAYLLRGESLRAAVAFHEVGKRAFNLGAYARCEQAYAKVMPLAEALDHKLLLTLAQGWIGAVKVELNQLEPAAILLDQAIAGAEALGHGPIQLFTLARRGKLHRQLGEIDEALACIQRALDIARALGDRYNEAMLCSRMAELNEDTGDHAAADNWMITAIEIGRELGNPDTLAIILLDSARVQEFRSAFAKERALLEEALSLSTQPNDLAAIHGHLGNLAYLTGDIVGSIPFHEEVLRTARMLGNTANEATALIALAQSFNTLNESDLVRDRIEEALPLVEAMDSGRMQITLQRYLAWLLTGLGDYASARSLIDEALKHAISAGDDELTAHIYNTDVIWHYDQGFYAEGLASCRKHMELEDHMHATDRAAALGNLAEFLVRLDRHEEARAPCEQAVELKRSAGDTWGLQSALLTLIEVVHSDGDLDRMAGVLAEAEACFESSRIDQLDPDRASRLRSRGLFHDWSLWNQEFVAASLEAIPLDAEARRELIALGFRRAGFWKGRSLLMGIAEHRQGKRSAAISSLRRDWKETVAERDTLLAELARGEREASARENQAWLRGRVRGLDQRVESLVGQLPTREIELDMPQGIAPEDLADVLGDDVLIEFVDGPEDLFAYVLSGGDLQFHRLGNRELLRSLVDSYVGGMSNPESLASVEQVAQGGRQLFDELLAPLLHEVAADARLVLIPTPDLAGLPFEALVTAAPSSPSLFSEVHFLVEQREINYAPSTPVLAALARSGPRSQPGPVLILGDPTYSERPLAVASRNARFDPSRSTRRPTSWDRLPGTRDEAVAIAGILMEAMDSLLPDQIDLGRAAEEEDLSMETDAFSLHLGESATTGLMDGDLRRFSVIHCASHGWVDRLDPRRSGLALAPSADDDGYLSVADILELDLDANLAVLSACQTGQGAALRGEGIQSVARAFLYAGARTVIASLWPVDDRETEAVMTSFYAGLLERGVPASTALRQARLAVRTAPGTGDAFRGQGRGGLVSGARSKIPRNDRIGHPYFWAPFVFIGAPSR